jgi:hypothetical protein
MEPAIDELIDHPLDLMSLEHEDGLARRDVDAVPSNTGACEIERRAGCDELGGALRASFL